MAFEKKKPMETIYLTGEAYFCSVHFPNTKFDKKFVMQLALEGAELEKAKKNNMVLKAPSKHVPKPHVEIKRNVKGPQTKDPVVIDATNTPIPKEIAVGNGSLVKVKVGLYDNTKGKNGAYMDTVKVTKLVAFVPQRDQEEAEFMAVAPDATGCIIEGLKKPTDMDDEIPF